MRPKVHFKPQKRISRMGFADFETETASDLAAKGVEVRCVSNRYIRIVEDGEVTDKVPEIHTKYGAMLVWDRTNDVEYIVPELSNPEKMILAFYEHDVERVYFHNSRFDLSFMVAWYYSHPDLVETKKGSYIEMKGGMRISIGKRVMGKQGMVYSVTFTIKTTKDKNGNRKSWSVDVWDSAKIWKSSLDNIGKDFGVLKGGTTGGSRATEVGISNELKEYCHQDCRVLATAMRYYFAQVEEFMGEPNGFMTAAATTYHMALYWLWKNFQISDEAMDKWYRKLGATEKQEVDAYGKENMFRDAKVRWLLPKLDTNDLVKSVKDENGDIIKDEHGHVVLEHYNLTNIEGEVVRNGRAKYSWMREGYKGATPLLNYKMKFARMGMCGLVVVKDVNSMFPFQMVIKKMPFGKAYDLNDLDWERLIAHPSDNWTWCAALHVDMKVKKGHRATFLSKKKFENSEGEDTTAMDEVHGRIVICEPEWEMILRDYDVEGYEFIEGVRFKATVGLFAGYIMYWYDVKQKSDKIGAAPNPALKAFAKLMINSFYGKFGSNSRIDEYDYACNNGVLRNKRVDIKTDEKSDYYLPLAMWTTAYARNMLSLGCNALGWENVIYTDTDSWHIINLTDEEATRRLEAVGIGHNGLKLGDAPTEGEYAMGAYFRAKGYMHFNEDGTVNEIKMAGANRFDMIKTVEDLDNMVTVNGKRGLWGTRLTQFNVKGGVLLYEVYVNILEDSITKECAVID